MTERERAPELCPICGKPADPELHPFCSRRCADVDLGRWLTGQYRIVGGPTEEEEELPGGSGEQT